MLTKYIYVNGKVMPADKPAILINDIGFLRSYGIFDFMRTYQGKIFYWPEHWQRFVNSARQLDLKVPIKKGEAEKIIYNLIKKNGLKEASIRLVLTGGPTTNGLDFNPRQPTFAILIETVHSLPAKLFQTGAKLITFDYNRLIPESKNLNYIWAVKLQQEKNKKKVVEILYTSGDKVLECSTSNFFIIKKNKLITAKEGILFGITRYVALELVKKHLPELVIEERELKFNELKTADEAFITATNKNILPITQIDNIKIGQGRIGEKTKKLMEAYFALIKNQ